MSFYFFSAIIRYWPYFLGVWTVSALLGLAIVVVRRATSRRPFGGFAGKVVNARRPSLTRPTYVAIEGRIHFRRYAEVDDTVVETVFLGGPDIIPEGGFAPSTSQHDADFAWARAEARRQLRQRKNG